MQTAWHLIRRTIEEFIADEALTRGASIAFYTVTSIAPVLFIVVAIAGLFFGQAAAQGAIVAQLGDLMGQDSALLLQEAINKAGNRTSGLLATAIGVITLLITASDVFVEMQSALNFIWKTEPKGAPITQVVKARVTSLGLVGTLGFLLMVSLVIQTAFSVMSRYIYNMVPFAGMLIHGLNLLISFGLISLLFAAIYRVLPDRHLTWRHVALGGMVTAVLFSIGRVLIGLYIGNSAIASTYGAAGSLIVVLLWIYYSAQIFLLGAEFIKVSVLHKEKRLPRPHVGA